MAVAASRAQSVEEFLPPLSIDLPKVIALAGSLSQTYKRLAAESENQFLPTPISDSILRPSVAEGGRYLAIDIGGTNLRVGFIGLSGVADDQKDELLPDGVSEDSKLEESRVTRSLEKSWPIRDHLKHENAEDLFAWIGECIAEVVEDGVQTFGEELPEELPMGVTFSFPMIQHSLSEATLMSMGKGFAITSNLDLGKQLRAGYAKTTSQRKLPRVKIVAIVNDTVATLISFAYQLKITPQRKAAMGLIVGTGNNATIPLKLSSLHPTKRYDLESIATTTQASEEPRIVINTEWSINGTAGPLNELGLITRWDKILDNAAVAPGFMPFEYMTAGGYLGELGRIVIMEYLTTQLMVKEDQLPAKIRTPNGLTTSFLGNFRVPNGPPTRWPAKVLNDELPGNSDQDAWHWTPIAATTVASIAKAIQRRAAGMTAAAIIGLLACAEELILIPDSSESPSSPTSASYPATGYTIRRPSTLPQRKELMVGYTGGCIVHFRDYLSDCQYFLDSIVEEKFKGKPPLRVVLQSCHDGGIVGAGVLAATAQNLAQ